MKNTSLQITIILFLVLSQMLLLSLESVGQSKEFKKKLKEANKALNIGNNIEAKKLFEEADEIEKNNIECLNGLMTVYYNDTDIENLCRILKIIIPELDSKIKNLEKNNPSKKEKNKIDKYNSYLDNAKNYQIHHQDDCNTDATVEENSNKGDSKKETNKSTTNEEVTPLVILDLDTSQTQNHDVNNDQFDDSKSTEIDSVGSLGEQKSNMSTDINLTMVCFTDVAKVKEQFENEIKGLLEKSISKHQYEFKELKHYNIELNKSINNIRESEDLEIEKLEDEILTTSTSINQLQKEIKKIDLEIDFLNNERQFYEQFNVSFSKKESEYKNKEDSSVYESSIKYYSNTLLIIQENKESKNGSRINKTIDAIDKIFDRHDNFHSCEIISFTGLFEEKDIMLYTIIKNYQTKNKLIANSVSPSFKGKIYKFSTNDKVICLNDATECNLFQSPIFEIPKSIKEIINGFEFSSKEELIRSKRPKNEFYKNEKARLSKLKVNDVSINQLKIQDLETKKGQLVDSIGIFQNKLDEYDKLINGKRVLLPILIMNSNIDSKKKFFLESGEDMWSILKKQIVRYALKEKIITVNSEEIDGVNFYWNELIEKNRQPKIYGYKLLKWGKLKDEKEYFLNCLFEIRFNEISTITTVEVESPLPKGKETKIIIKSPTTSNSPTTDPANNESLDNSELKIEKEDDVNILIFNTSRWKYINGTTNFSDFLSIKQNENLMGWILPDEEGLRNVLKALYNGDGGDLINQLSISNTSTLFLTKEKRIDSRTQEFMVKVLSIESNGTIKTKEVVEGEDVNILLNSKYEY